MGGVNLELGGADVGKTVWRVADNLEKTCCVSYYFCGKNFKN